YADVSSLSYPVEAGRWWVSSIASQERGVAHLLACDLGSTIPVTLPETARKGGASNLEALGRLLGMGKSRDEALMTAAFEEGVTRRPDGRGGHGLVKMSKLIKAFPDGHLSVWSGGALATISKKNPDVRTQKLPRRFDGTYILWNLRQEP